eukprot:PhF_6_TR5325/c0_g1_i1/m.7689
MTHKNTVSLMLACLTNGDLAQATQHAHTIFQQTPTTTLNDVQQHLRLYHPLDPTALMLINAINKQRPRLQFWWKNSWARANILTSSLQIVYERLCKDSVREIKCEDLAEDDYILVS